MSDFSNEMAKKIQEIHHMAVQKGWPIQTRTPLEVHMLVVSEIAEATEEVRNGTPPIYQNYMPTTENPTGIATPGHEDWNEGQKPEGELIELADAVIRIMDYCGQRGWDLGEAIEMKVKFNSTRPHRHGGKRH
jgi:NTP pyrophosphatase (non-canonical NTP hydrolase)